MHGDLGAFKISQKNWFLARQNLQKKNHLANKLMNKPCLFDKLKFLQNFNLKSFEEFLDFTIFETWKFL